jgi:hypothetical protein
MVDQSIQQKLEKGLTHSLNTHGFSFQYAVLKTANIIFGEKKSPWAFEVSEFPVTVKDIPTHIDFILRNKNEPFYLIGECKRANPALSNWCFVKAPYVSRKISSGERIVREVISFDPNVIGGKPKIGLDWIERSKDVYRLAFEVKSEDKGDGKYGRGQINEATTQVLRGLNGLINFFINHYIETNQLPLGRYANNLHRVAFMPVIFTTAKLWVSDVDLSLADLETGKIDFSAIKMHPKEWLFYHHSQSPNIKHSFGSFKGSKELSDVLYLDYTRTISIVNSSGIQSFLCDNFWEYPEDWNIDQLIT